MLQVGMKSDELPVRRVSIQELTRLGIHLLFGKLEWGVMNLLLD